jgi:hypothetical protein
MLEFLRASGAIVTSVIEYRVGLQPALWKILVPMILPLTKCNKATLFPPRNGGPK